MNLFAKQEIENEMINKTTKFIKVCAIQNGRMSHKTAIFLNLFQQTFIRIYA